MLNKLLKRCMPWMDKGRWYHVHCTAELISDELAITDIRYDEPMFSSYELDDYGNVRVYFSDPLINASIIELKGVVNLNLNNDQLPLVLNVNDYLIADRDNSGYFIGASLYPGVTDIWAYIKIN